MNKTTQRIDDYWMSRTPRQFLFHVWITFPVLILTLLAAMVAVVEFGY